METNVPYTIDEIIKNFIALMKDMNFSQELSLLGISRFHFIKRKIALQHIQALTTGLWQLALQRSFPLEYEKIFSEYLSTLYKQHPKYKKSSSASKFQKIIISYVSLLELHKDTNFTDVSSHLIKTVNFSAANNKALQLKLALAIRDIYNFLFQRLI